MFVVASSSRSSFRYGRHVRASGTVLLDCLPFGVVVTVDRPVRSPMLLLLDCLPLVATIASTSLLLPMLLLDCLPVAVVGADIMNNY